MRRLKLLGTVSVLALVLNAGTARAADYLVSDEAEFVAAIASANADGDAGSTIVLTGNLALAAPSLLPTITKSLTINTGAYTLSAAGDTVFDTTAGQTVTVNGNISGTNLLTKKWRRRHDFYGDIGL